MKRGKEQEEKTEIRENEGEHERGERRDNRKMEIKGGKGDKKNGED